MYAALRTFTTLALLMATLLGQGANAVMQLHVVTAHDSLADHHRHGPRAGQAQPDSDHRDDHSHELCATPAWAARVAAAAPHTPAAAAVVQAFTTRVNALPLPVPPAAVSRAGPPRQKRHSILRL